MEYFFAKARINPYNLLPSLSDGDLSTVSAWLLTKFRIMPYRRLPNTDAARMSALKVALKLSQETSPVQLAFSQVTLNRLRTFVPTFEAAVVNYKRSYSSTVTRNRDYPKLMRKAKLYISHFIQVLTCLLPAGSASGHTGVFRSDGVWQQSARDEFGVGYHSLGRESDCR
jgi:hypothetical protein